MEKIRLIALIDLFATHPSVNVFHLTSDNTGFFTDHAATAHAGSLQDKTVNDYSRTFVEGLAALEEKKEPTTTKAKAATPAAGVKTEIQLLRDEYLKVFGKKPANVLNAEKLKTAIDAEKAKPAAQAKEIKTDPAASAEGTGSQE